MEAAPSDVAAGEVRLTLAGAVFDQRGSLTLSAYSDLRGLFPASGALDKWEDHPGCLPEEVANLEGVRHWCDARALKVDKQGKPMSGEGWIAIRPRGCPAKPSERWFNRKAWGSWRLCFLLARQQHLVWTRQWYGDVVPSVPSAPEALPEESLTGASQICSELPVAAEDACESASLIDQLRQRQRLRQDITTSADVSHPSPKCEGTTRTTAVAGDKKKSTGKRSCLLDEGTNPQVLQELPKRRRSKV
ncbi:unnamed protein product [Polarella glacialis]|uniref:Uncharacterized protein n=1 Tax=Polarella glacialis TaxID=89957 RepID=A0A813M172_POLGL|nr:unnamed protein product [Polarella glacialis]|mmetsp:Transcript_44281/g.71702  ORF Transcript_44281/g.71702 Transcript_44281/m.71702 type:complete len:247 (-) Transcript_44281:99-839(-)